jgi:hypothetical protein
MKRQARIKRLEDIWFEFLVASTATRLLEARLTQEPSFGDGDGWRFRDAIRWRNNLESTFVIRIYADFEASLRDAWKDHFRQVTQPPMKDLLVAIAARVQIPDVWLEEMDFVREYRNSLIHSGKESLLVVPLEQARSRMARFLSWLPLDW